MQISKLLKILHKKVNIKQFFLFYDNIYFYKKVQNQRVYNKNHQIAYIIRYICFIKGQAFFLHYIINYEAVNKLISLDFLLILAEYQYLTKAIYYTLF